MGTNRASFGSKFPHDSIKLVEHIIYKQPPANLGAQCLSTLILSDKCTYPIVFLLYRPRFGAFLYCVQLSSAQCLKGSDQNLALCARTVCSIWTDSVESSKGTMFKNTNQAVNYWCFRKTRWRFGSCTSAKLTRESYKTYTEQDPSLSFLLLLVRHLLLVASCYY